MKNLKEFIFYRYPKLILPYIKLKVKTLEVKSNFIKRKNKHYKAHEKWLEANKYVDFRIHYNLNENSIIMDIGGFQGEWTEQMVQKFNCHSYIFEPTPTYYDVIVKKFKNNLKVRPFCFGLAAETGEQKFSIDNNASSSIKHSSNNYITAKFVSIIDFMNEHNLTSVDLAKVNIEGGEYELLEKLIETGFITRFKNLQIQFHDVKSLNSEVKMAYIQKELKKTHECNWHFRPYVWENWVIKNKGK